MPLFSSKSLFFLLLTLLSIPQLHASEFNQDFSGQKIVVGGTGDSQKLLREIAKVLQDKLKGGEIEVPDTIGSTGGIKSLVAGRIDLARVARPLQPNEKKHNLTYLLFAKNPVVFVTHPSVSIIDNLQSDDVFGIYAGEIRNWNKLGDLDHKIYPVTREPGDASIKVLNEHLPEFKVNPSTSKTMFSNPETITALTTHKYTIGYLPLSNVKDTSLRIMQLDGVEPSPENVLNGRYKLTMQLAIVYKQKPEGLAKVFIDFLYSKQGQKIISDFGAIPIDR